MAVIFRSLRIILYLAKVGFSCHGKPLLGVKSLCISSVNPWYYWLLTVLRFSSRSYDSFSLPCLPIYGNWGIIILANAQNMHLQVGSRSWLTSWLSSVQSVSWSASVLQETGKAVGYDRYTLAGSGLHIGCHSRTPSRKIPWQTETLVGHSSLHRVSVALVFCNFPVPPFLWW